jgi:tetratricopeptide (TPR) repeat protein
VEAFDEGIVMSEVQDLSKATRNAYFPLMELAHQEDPTDVQICFWLGREYMWANRLEQAIDLLERYLALPTSTWAEERSEAMRYLARMQPEKRMLWLERARIEAPHRREIWLDLAEEFHGQEDWPSLFWACTKGIEATRRTNTYLDDSESWGYRLFDLASISAWRMDSMTRAVEWCEKALDLAPDNDRVSSNLEFFRKCREELRSEA